MPYSRGGGAQSITSCGVRITNPTAASLQAAIDSVTASATEKNPGVLVVCGNMSQEGPVSYRSNLILDWGVAAITPTFSVPGQADNPLNYLFGARGALDPTFTTTLAAPVYSRGKTVTLTSVVGLAIGDYLSFSGVGCSLPGMSGTPGGVVEMKRVAGITGAVVTLGAPFCHCFSSTPATAVTRVNPLLNLRVIGGRLDGDASDIATGLYVEYALNLSIDCVQAGGFSRAAIEMTNGTAGFAIGDYTRLGGSNCDIFLTTTQHGRIHSFDFVAGGDLQHDDGIPRADIECRRQNCYIKILDSIIGGGNIGVEWWGGLHMTMKGVLIYDCDPTERIARCGPDGLDGMTTGGPIGSGFSGGANYVPLAEFGYAWEIDVAIGEVVTPQNGNGVAWSAFFHDCLRANVTFSVVNEGPALQAGVCVNDIRGKFSHCEILGCARPLRFENGNYFSHWQQLHIDTECVGLTYFGPAFEFAFSALPVLAASVEMDDVRVDTAAQFAVFTDQTFSRIIMHRVTYTDWWAQPLDEIEAFHVDSDFAIGAICEPDPTQNDFMVAAGSGGDPARCFTVAKGQEVLAHRAFFSTAKPGQKSQVRVASAQAAVPGNFYRNGTGASAGRAVVDAAAGSSGLGVGMRIKSAGAESLMPTD